MKILNFKVINKRAAGICYIFFKKVENKNVKDEKHRKVKDHCHYAIEYRGAANSLCNLKYSVPKKLLYFFQLSFQRASRKI